MTIGGEQLVIYWRPTNPSVPIRDLGRREVRLIHSLYKTVQWIISYLSPKTLLKRMNGVIFGFLGCV